MTRGPAHNPDRSEELWFGQPVEKYAALREQLDELASNTVANGLIGALIAGDFESLGSNTRAAYRALLREVGPPAGRSPGRRRVTTGRARGSARLELVGAGSAAGLAGLAGLAAATGSPVVAAVFAGVSLPIILGESSEGLVELDFEPEVIVDPVPVLLAA